MSAPTPATPVPNAPLSDGWKQARGSMPDEFRGKPDVGITVRRNSQEWDVRSQSFNWDLWVDYRLASPAPASSEGGETDWTAATQAAWDANNAPPALDGTAKGLEDDLTDRLVEMHRLALAVWEADRDPDMGRTLALMKLGDRAERLSHTLVQAMLYVAYTRDTDHAEASRQLAEANARVAKTERDYAELRDSYDAVVRKLGIEREYGFTLHKRALAAEADAAKVREENAKHERTIARQHKQASTARSFWLRAARAALNGDMRELRNRVDMADAPPVDVVLSDDLTQRGA